MDCPVCGSAKTVEGFAMPGSEDGLVMDFYPKGIKFWQFLLTRSVRFINGTQLRACTGCGHVWAQVDPQQLTALLKRGGSDEVVKKILE